MTQQHYPFSNPPLPYSYDALEPYIDEKTVRIHHDKHLQTYVNNLNLALKDYPEYQHMTLEELILNAYFMPQAIQVAVWNNAGGVYNHIFYFNGMTPNRNAPTGNLAKHMLAMYGSFEQFQEKFTNSALSVFGSGYAWLVLGMDGHLSIITTKNQNTPLPSGVCPILGIDVWEHAYYLKHQNEREAYIRDWFQVVNWQQANENYEKCMR